MCSVGTSNKNCDLKKIARQAEVILVEYVESFFVDNFVLIATISFVIDFDL